VARSATARLAIVAVLALCGFASVGCGVLGSHLAALSVRASAQQDADRLLATFPVPTGATRLDGAPPGIVDMYPMSPVSSDMVQSTGWWRTRGTVNGVVDAALARLPAEAKAYLSGGRGIAAKLVVRDEEFMFPAHDLLRQRLLMIAATQSGADVVIRVDGIVLYAKPKPESAIIGRSATVVVASMVGHRGTRSVGKTYGPITISDPKRVRELATYINAMPPPAAATSSCPAVRADDHPNLTLRFWTSVGGRPLGTVTMEFYGCGSMSVRPVYGTNTELDITAVSVRQILQILGLNWLP
jgi:hypothetical protein